MVQGFGHLCLLFASSCAQIYVCVENIFVAAGFNDIRFQYEPIAAAFAHELTMGGHERLAVVMDIGGGTSDFTIMRLSEQHIQKTDRQDDILANAGIRVGGSQ